MSSIYHDHNKVRIGHVTNIDYDTNLCEVQFYDKLGGSRQKVHLCHPYVGRGWGVLVGVEIGSIVIVTEEHDGNIRLLGYLPHPHFFNDDVSKFNDVSDDESPYKKARSGEIVLQSKANSHIALNSAGDIVLETPEGNVIELDRESDTIFQQSSQRLLISDAGKLVCGVVRRDVRSLEERQLDVIFGGSTSLGFDLDVFTETIGVDPNYPNIGTEGGKNKPINPNLIPGLVDPYFPPTIEKGRGSGVNISDMLNPALTEWRMELAEFGDGNPGLDAPLLNDQAKFQGHLEPNTLADITLGTVVNEAGRQIRFDYYFGMPFREINGKIRGKGHGAAWSTWTNQNGVSWDHHFDRSNALKSKQSIKPDAIAAPGQNQGSEWTVDTYVQSATALMFRALLHTKGVDNFGRKETELSIAFRSGDEKRVQQSLQNSFSGSLWELAIDKEGLTKVNIPAATNINGLEPYREGRSLLMNMDGDATVTIGKQKATGNFGLPRITTDFFLNRNDYPNYGRKDRSLTLDMAGNFEAFIGADDNVNQSIMLQADGSMALSLGKEGTTGITNRSGTPAGVDNLFDKPITKAAKTTTRQDRSLTGRFAGNIELEVGSDQEAKQSIIISTTGGNGFIFGKDKDAQSIKMATDGGIHIQIQGPMNERSYALHIDAKGVIHIAASGDVQIETKGKCSIDAEKDITVNSKANINIEAAKDFTVKAGKRILMNAPIIELANIDSQDKIRIEQAKIEMSTQSMNIISPSGISMLGSVGIVGKFAAQGAPGAPIQKIARIGDLVQVGPSIGQIISGSGFSTSA